MRDKSLETETAEESLRFCPEGHALDERGERYLCYGCLKYYKPEEALKKNPRPRPLVGANILHQAT